MHAKARHMSVALGSIANPEILIISGFFGGFIGIIETVWRRGKAALVVLFLALIAIYAGIDVLSGVLISMITISTLGRIVSSAINKKNKLEANIVYGFLLLAIIISIANILHIVSQVSVLLSSSCAIYAFLLVIKATAESGRQKRLRLLGELFQAGKISWKALGSGVCLGLIGFCLYGFYFGYIDQTPEAWDAYTLYAKMLNNLQSDSSLYTEDTFTRVHEQMPLGIMCVNAYLYTLGGWPCIRIVMVLSIFACSGTIRDILNNDDHPLDKNTSAWISLFLISNPIVYFSITQVYQEVFVFVALVACISIMLSLQSRKLYANSAAMAMAGLVLGSSMGLKPILIYYVAFIICILMAEISTSDRSNIRLVPLAAFIITFTPVGALYYYKAYAETGNPVFPFYNLVFKSKNWWQYNFETPYSKAPDIFWLFKAASDSNATYMESSFGYVSILSVALVILLISFVIFVSISNIGSFPNIRNPLAEITNKPIVKVVLVSVLPAIFLLFSQNYSRYISQSLLLLPCCAIAVFSSRLNSRLLINTIFHILLSIGIAAQALYINAANFGPSRSPLNWSVKWILKPVINPEANQWHRRDKIFTDLILKSNHSQNEKDFISVLSFRELGKPYSPYTPYRHLNGRKIYTIVNDWLYPEVQDCIQGLGRNNADLNLSDVASLLKVDFVVIQVNSSTSFEKSVQSSSWVNSLEVVQRVGDAYLLRVHHVKDAKRDIQAQVGAKYGICQNWISNFRHEYK
jgi:hypothetical protein